MFQQFDDLDQEIAVSQIDRIMRSDRIVLEI
jgi:hypothetical protein